ncbi:hypothetical protein PL9214670052 [Planktothrix tepida PCC 9214]|uniref:Uncharacterized protein n=1 Tax=Planktothrix tepida PCC 9214 TaxID=671072 RepID=A0A1J1LTT8_9CYAN|nr:hypothetical protein PL9214670052 [Planktothrix tepida PCC 9214]
MTVQGRTVGTKYYYSVFSETEVFVIAQALTSFYKTKLQS